MLNKNDIEILTALCNMLGDGYEVITVDDIAEFTGKDAENLSDVATIIKTLDTEKYISLKYALDGYFCLSVLPFGRRKVQEFNVIPVAKLSDKAIIKTADDGSQVIAVAKDNADDANEVLEQLMGTAVEGISSEDNSKTDNSLLPATTQSPKKFGVKAFFAGLFGGVLGSGIVTALYYVLDVVLGLF